MKKIISMLLIIVMVGGLVTSCKSDTQDEADNTSKENNNTEVSDNAEQVTLTIWHENGENGDKWFTELNKLFKETYPNVEINAVNFPTDQWIQKSIASINTNTAPDIIFNNYERVIKVENQTHGILDLSEIFGEIEDTSFLTDEDLGISKYNGKQIIIPVQRVQMAFGVRKSWLENVNGTFPSTWDEAVELGYKFKNEDPDQNGKDDTYGFALEAAKPRDLVHMLDLFGFGSGIKHTIIDPEGNILINDPDHVKVTEQFIDLFHKDELVAKDTINYTFTDMYQVIEGGKAGMFRVGDWNVKKWADVLGDDYMIGPWPAFENGENNVVIGGMRGLAIPQNAPNLDEAKLFAKFILSKEAQEASLLNLGSAVRSDLEAELTENQKFFAQPEHALIAYDFPESINDKYVEIEEAYHKRLINVLADNSLDLKEELEKAEEEIKAILEK